MMKKIVVLYYEIFQFWIFLILFIRTNDTIQLFGTVTKHGFVVFLCLVVDIVYISTSTSAQRHKSSKFGNALAETLFCKTFCVQKMLMSNKKKKTKIHLQANQPKTCYCLSNFRNRWRDRISPFRWRLFGNRKALPVYRGQPVNLVHIGMIYHWI